MMITLLKEFYKVRGKCILTLFLCFLHQCNADTCKTQQVCFKGNKVEQPLYISDSVTLLFKEFDNDETDYWIIDELIQSVIKHSEFPVRDSEAVDKATKYLTYLDDNLDEVVDIYELRFSLFSITSSNAQESVKKINDDKDYIYWLRTFIGESPQLYPFYLVKIFQILDEDMNGKLTWKEIRMAIKLVEMFGNVIESSQMEERAREDLVATIKLKYQQKWLNLEELWTLFNQLGLDADKKFYHWLLEFFGGNTEHDSELVKDSTRKEFENLDTDSNGIISKGELVAALHGHRKGYYTDQRINRKWTRADRNRDGLINFNEFAFLEELKHPQTK